MRTKGHGTEHIYLPSVAHSELCTFIKMVPKCLAWGPISHPRVWITARKIMPDQKRRTTLALFIAMHFKGQAGKRRRAKKQQKRQMI